MNFRTWDMEKFATDKVNEYLGGLLHRRFGDIDEVCNNLLVQKGIYRIKLVEEKGRKDHIEDDYLIGQIYFIWELNGESYSASFDIQVWYIKDNYGNMYVTETSVLEMLDEEYNLKK